MHPRLLGLSLPWLGTVKMKQHWRYLIARWGALPVVRCAAGEQTMPWYNSGSKEAEIHLLRREWNEVIRSMRATDPFKRLITTHPRSNARDETLDPTLLDFEMQQIGHAAPTEEHAAKALAAWNRAPVMPVVSGEALRGARNQTHATREGSARSLLGAPGKQRLRGPHLRRQRRLTGEPPGPPFWQFTHRQRLGRHAVAGSHEPARLDAARPCQEVPTHAAVSATRARDECFHRCDFRSNHRERPLRAGLRRQGSGCVCGLGQTEWAGHGPLARADER